MQDNMKDFSVLYIEKNAIIQKELTNLINKIFSKLYVAKNETEAITFFEKSMPDIVITDINFKNINAADMIRNLKRVKPDIQVIVTSSLTNVNSMIDLFHVGLTDFIRKPVDFNLLKNAINKAIKNLEKEIHFQQIENNILINSKNYIESFLIFKNKRIQVDFINHFKGIPIINSGYIKEVDIQEGHILIDTVHLHKNTGSRPHSACRRTTIRGRARSTKGSGLDRVWNRR